MPHPFPPPAIQIGDLTVDPPILQAPMAGFTNAAFRQIVRQYGGAGLLATEMVNARGFVWLDEHEAEHPDRLWGVADEPRPLAVQIWDNDPDIMAKVGRCYRSLPALHAADHDGHGFAWLSWTDHENSVLSYVRRHEEDHAIVLLNFTPVPREAYRVGAPRPGRYRVALNSDSEFYGGSNAGVASVDTEPVPAMGHAQSVALTLPPLAGLILVPERPF